MIDQATTGGSIGIGTTLATGLFVGRSGVTTTIQGPAVTQSSLVAQSSMTCNVGVTTDLVASRTGVAMVIGTNAGGLTLAPTNSTITIDQATTGAAISIGQTLATAITLGRTSITTTIPGPLFIVGDTISRLDSTTMTNGASGAFTFITSYLYMEMQRRNNVIKLTWRPLTGATVATAAAAIALGTSLGVNYRPPVQLVMSAMIAVNGTIQLGTLTITAIGEMTFSKTTGAFSIGESLIVHPGSVNYTFV